MKKTSLIVVFILSIASTKAQTVFGLKAGANISNLKASSGGISLVLDSKVGFNGGMFFTIPSGKNFSIQPELVYSMEGAKFKQTGDDLTLHYINVPVMFQFNSAGLIAEAGPQIGVLLAAKENTVTATSAYENVSVALGLGAGYRFSAGVGVSGRYNFGLTNIDKTGGQGSKVVGNVIQLGLTFSLSSIKRK